MNYLLMLKYMGLQLLSATDGIQRCGPVADAGLIEERSFLLKHTGLTYSKYKYISPKFIELVRQLVSVCSGPLSLQQLSRIAIRRSVGGVHFAQRFRNAAPAAATHH